MKPYLKKYCETNHLYSDYDRKTCLKILNPDHNEWNFIDVDAEHIESLKKYHIDHNEEYKVYKNKKVHENDKIKQSHLFYSNDFVHMLNPQI